MVRKETKLFAGLPWWQGASILLLIGWLYVPVVIRLVTQWNNDPNAGHGFFVPAFALFVLWKNRNELKKVQAVPSWNGLYLILAGLALLILGDYVAELYLSRVSLLIVLAGLIVLFHGWPLFRAVLFPWAFLFLMIPIPVIIFQKVTFPLQLLASKLASAALPHLGVVVYREGNVIELATMKLQVVTACSGIRSLLAMLTLAIIYGYLLEDRNWVRVTLAIAAIPIAVVANSFRVVGTGLVARFYPEKAEGFYHSFEGWLIFVVSLTMLFAFHSLIARIWRHLPKVNQPLRAAASQTSMNRGLGTNVDAKSPVRFVVIVILLAACALLLRVRPSREVFPPRASLSSLPTHIGDWEGEDISIDQQTLDILGAGEFLNRNFVKAGEPHKWIDLLIAYFPSQRAGDTIHTPNHCLLGAGWVPAKREIVQLSRSDGTTFPANRAVWITSKGGERNLVMYWFQAHDREVASEYLSKYYLVADSIRMNRSDGALVRLITPMSRGESADEAEARVMGFGSQLIPNLNTYIPR